MPSPAATRAGASGSARWSMCTRVFADPEPILDEVELIILAVPDDADRAAGRLAPDVQRPGDDPHQRRARRRGPRPGDGGRDPDRRPSTRSSHSPTRNGRSRRSTARRSRSRATTSWRRCWPTWPRRSGRRRSGWRPGRRPPITPRRCWPPVASSPCSTRSPSWPGGRPRRGRFAGDLRPADRGDAGQRPGARDPGGADRADDPRRRRDARRRTSRRCAATPRACSTCTSRRPAARSIWPRPVARWHRRPRRRCAIVAAALQGRPEPVP